MIPFVVAILHESLEDAMGCVVVEVEVVLFEVEAHGSSFGNQEREKKL